MSMRRVVKNANMRVRYQTTPPTSAPVAGLFKTFSNDFPSPFNPSKNGKWFALIALENLTGWPIKYAMENETEAVIVNILDNDVVLTFGLAKRVVSDSATALSAGVVKEYMGSRSIDLRLVFAYASMANRRTEQMVAANKLAIKSTVVRADLDWADVVPRVLYRYRKRH